MTKFKSGLEKKFSTDHNLEYEPTKFKYTLEHSYTPDWKLGENHYIETKGRWISSDRTKLLAVLQSNPELTIVMVFSNPNTKLSKKSKTSYSDWCNKHKIKWFKVGTEELKEYIDLHL